MKLEKYIALIKRQLTRDYEGMFREAGGVFAYPFLVPGSASYSDCLWDWDSWLADVALCQILQDLNDAEATQKALPYQQGCILNFLNWGGSDGWLPITVSRSQKIADIRPANIYKSNMHKPCLAQHAALLVSRADDDAEWLRDHFAVMQCFVNNYLNHHQHPETGLLYWQDDYAIGVDNDPCIFYRPPASTGSIYLNSLMYRELIAIEFLCRCLRLDEVGDHYAIAASNLAETIKTHCWDERDGFFYNTDINLQPIDRTHWLHMGQPRSWSSLIMRIGVWSGFLAMWSGIATPDQAERVVHEHLLNEKTFCATYGVRTLSKMEKMYDLRASGNPSSWLGPVWGVSNYLVFSGLVKYGFISEAKSLVEKTIYLFGRDLERFGALHEYYQPDNGEPIINRGFQNWNYLVLNMIAWLEGRTRVNEF